MTDESIRGLGVGADEYGKRTVAGITSSDAWVECYEGIIRPKLLRGGRHCRSWRAALLDCEESSKGVVENALEVGKNTAVISG